MVASCVKLLTPLKKRLTSSLSSGTSFSGALYGLEVNGVRLVVGAAGQPEEGGYKIRGLELLNEMLPCGVEPMGVFGVGLDIEELVPLVQELPLLTQPSQTPVMLSINEEGIVGRLYWGEILEEEVVVETISEEELGNMVTLIRVKGKLELNCGQTSSEISNAFKHLIEKISCPYGSFLLEGGRVVFLHRFLEKGPGKGWTSTVEHQEEEDCFIVGVEDQGLTVEQLWQYTAQEEVDDGWGNTGTKSVKVQPRDKLELSVLWNYSNPACTSRTIGCAPIVHREVKEGATCTIPVPVDALGVISSTAPATSLMEILKGAVGRQVGDVAAAVLSELKMKGTISTPEVFHFLPASLGHYVTLVYTKAATQGSFETFRRSIHTSLMLPLDRPMFRRANAVSWVEGDKLVNVHHGLEGKHGVEMGEVAMVEGVYTYYHYMQDKFDDDGWGCAYRSLQTLISWFRQQGYTETEVPTHKEIQKCLVDIGDKEAKFIGSKQWIGSTEVGFVLDTSCGIQSRFVSVSQGADLGSKARELLVHFQNQGTPVMIGGGVYAHTILGVAWDEATGDCKWLVLDPHYTGAEDIKTIHTKGWCGWKGPNFWNQTAFYNMCLPQKPKDII